jgi:hypothetical protein
LLSLLLKCGGCTIQIPPGPSNATAGLSRYQLCELS